MIPLVKYALWIISSGIAFAGAWFVKFTIPDPKDPQGVILTKAGRLTLPLATIGLIGAFTIEVVSQRQAADRAVRAADAETKRQAEADSMRVDVRTMAESLSRLLAGSPALQNAVASDHKTTQDVNTFLDEAARVDPDLQEIVAQTRRFMTGVPIKTDLEKAVESGDTTRSAEILASGRDPDASGDSGTPPLLMAAIKGDISTANLLIDKGANVNARSKFSGYTALMTATMGGRSEMVAYLLKRGADVNVRDNHGQTALDVAVAYERHDLLELLLKHEANPNTETPSGRTPLREAVSRNFKDDVAALLAAGADPNAAPPPQRETALHALAQSCSNGNRIEVFELLVHKGARCGAKSANGSTPLAWAVQKNCPAYVTSLIACGANANDCGFPDQESCLAKAVKWGHKEVAAILRKNGGH